MQINSLTLGGFKGIKSIANLPLAPITLLFGANSTGKTTILQGLLYLYEILANNNPDPEYSELAGQKMFLGGFHNLVHGKNSAGVITLGVTVSFDEDERTLLSNYLTGAEEELLNFHLGETPDISSNLGLWGFEIQVAWSSLEERAFIQRYKCYGDVGPACDIKKKSGQPHSVYHVVDMMMYCDLPDPIAGGTFDFMDDVAERVGQFTLNKQANALPDLSKRFDFSSFLFDWEELDSDIPLAYQTYAEGALSQVCLAPLKALKKHLASLLHIGPLRIIPDASHHISKKSERSWWFDGKGAWDQFAHATSDYQNKVNQWFFNEGGFVAPYQIVNSRPDQAGQQFVYVNNLDTGTTHQLTELGAGVSQVFPVVAGLCLDRGLILSCEQPELHIHPKWQLVLADIMLESIKDEHQKLFLMETHSEHIMLRLLRRRKETADGSLENPDYACNAEDVQIIFCDLVDGKTRLRAISTTDEGEFDAPWPNGFFAERRGELF